MDCKYCDETLETEEELHQHWLNVHSDELTSHDKDAAKRTVNKLEQKQQEKQMRKRSMYRTAGIAVIALLAVAGIGYGAVQSDIVSFSSDDGPSSSFTGAMTAPGTAHYHTQMEVVVNGDRTNFAQPQYMTQDRRVHFEGGDGSTLHFHANGVPLSYFFNSFNWELTENSATINGKTYSDVTVTVNGEEVDNAADYVPREGESVRVKLSGNGVDAEQTSQTATNEESSRTIEVSGGEYFFNPSTISVKQGEKVTVKFTNTGRVPHDLRIPQLNAGSDVVQPGQSDSFTFTAPKSGDFPLRVVCSLPGHARNGMTGTLTSQ